MKQAACGGTGCAVLNGETLLQSHWAALGGLHRERSVSIGLTGSRPWLRKGMWRGEEGGGGVGGRSS